MKTTLSLIATGLLARIAKSKVKLFYYIEREEVDLASAIGKFQAILGMFGGEITREKQRGHQCEQSSHHAPLLASSEAASADRSRASASRACRCT